MPLKNRGGIDIDQVALAKLSGGINSDQFVTTDSGAKTPGHGGKWDANGNWIDAGTVAGAWVEEVPAGTLDGANPTFTLSNTPIAGSLTLMLNILQREGTDFTITGPTITFTVAPKATDAGWFNARYQA